MNDNKRLGTAQGEPFDKLDVAIDRAVRRMMAVEPRAGMRGRVLARIGEPQPWAFPRLAYAVAAAAMIILAVVMWKPARPVESPDAPLVVASNPPSEPVTTAPAPVTQPVPERAAPAAGPTERPRRERLPDPPSMAQVFGPARDRVAASSIDTVTTPTAIVAAPLQRIEMRISPLLFQPVRLPQPPR
jgi:hypothetical protein